MIPDYTLLSKMGESFAIATGVPAFLVSPSGAPHTPSPGFLLDEYRFADLAAVSRTVRDELIGSDALSLGEYCTLYTEHEFIYNLVRLESSDAGVQIHAAGPMRLRVPSRRELRSLSRCVGADRLELDTLEQRISAIPRVSMSRIQHVGRVQAALCESYVEGGGRVMSSVTTPGSQTGGSVPSAAPAEKTHREEPAISFTLVDEESHVSYELMAQVKELVASGDVEGVRALRSKSSSAPLDKLIESDALRSVRYNVITACAVLVGIMFDRDLPYEQVMMTADYYIRQADRTSTIDGLVRLTFDAAEAFAVLVKRYSTRSYPKAVKQVLHFLQANMTEKVTLKDLAELTELSPSYLSRLIKRETGLSLSGLMNSYRVNESKQLLLRTEYSVFEIAHMVGFTYQNHFAQQFKAWTGLTPSDYRYGKYHDAG